MIHSAVARRRHAQSGLSQTICGPRAPYSRHITKHALDRRKNDSGQERSLCARTLGAAGRYADWRRLDDRNWLSFFDRSHCNCFDRNILRNKPGLRNRAQTSIPCANLSDSAFSCANLKIIIVTVLPAAAYVANQVCAAVSFVTHSRLVT